MIFISGIKLALLCLCVCAGYWLLFQDASAEKAVRKIERSLLLFRYCPSCGYRKAFDEYAKILVDKYPQLAIRGTYYDPPFMNYIISKIIFGIKVTLIVCLVSSLSPFHFLALNTPAWWAHMHANKLYAAMAILVLGNIIEGFFMSSGAFEITLNDDLVWSKLQTGRIPTLPELFQILDNVLQ